MGKGAHFLLELTYNRKGAKEDVSLTPTRLCECGCGNPAPIAQRTNTRLGHKKGEQIRFIKGHSGGLVAAGHQVEDRGHDTPCWIWLGGRTENGYGRTRWNGKMAPAHRAYWEARNHRRVPDGLFLDHLCRVRICVNPDHLEPVTHTENVRRSPSTRLTPDLVAEIRAERDRLLARWPEGRVRTARGERDEVARRYGISSHYVKHIWAGRAWAA